MLELLSAAIDPQPLYPEHPEVGNPLAVSALRPVQIAVGFAGGAVILVSLVVAAVSLVLRYRLSARPVVQAGPDGPLGR